MHRYFLVPLIIALYGCTPSVPKPKGALRLDYPEQAYYLFTPSECEFSFEVNDQTKIISASSCDFNIEYPKMKATIYLSYKPVDKNLKKLIKNAQKLTYEHTIKADQITAQNFINDTTKVYGTLYEITGNTASQVQFYATDSTHHFLTGSVYFRVKPNYDSILPAADYLKKDVQKLMESLRWKPAK